uniref:Uncharacterized protein n=1 Tax=Oryza punctata TaxID=4537 RepID=A0A0E0M3M6_ORYPU
MLPVSVAPRRREAGLLIATRPRWWRRRRRVTALDVLWNAEAALAAATIVMIDAALGGRCMLHAACVIVEQWVGSEEDDDAGSTPFSSSL